MNAIHRLISLFLLTITVLLLSHCAPTTTPMSEQQLANPYPLSASEYLQQAKDVDGLERQQALVKAAGRLIADGSWHRGRQILNQIKPQTPAIKTEKQFLLSKIEIIRNKPSQAIRILSNIDTQDLSLYDKIQYHQLLSTAYVKRQTPVNSVEERIKLETLLPNEAMRAENRRKIWLTLTTLPPSTLTTLALEAEDGSDLQAWLELAAIPRKYRYQPEQMVKAINNWQQQFANHPAIGMLPPNINKMERELTNPPKKIALLLPLSGPIAGPGKAIRDGFMASFYQNKNKSPANVRFYDTNKSEVTELYSKAVNQGADYVVGPLTKSNVEKVAQLSLPVRTIALNDIPGNGKPNLYQFGLSPSDEAKQVALKARSNGLTRALIIAPQGVWGDEIVQSFSNTWRSNGGAVIDTLRLAEGQNVNDSVKTFLHISDSEQRQKQLKQLLGQKLKVLPRRRQDFDMIFLLAYPSLARQVQPMLKYYFAGDIPVYASSSVYAATTNQRKDRDLDGIIFCDMPWVFKHNLAKKNDLWPEQLNSYNRLYALGLDSYSLGTQLNQLLLFPAMGIDDKTGILYLKPDHQLTRLLEWAQFKDGIATPLDANIG